MSGARIVWAGVALGLLIAGGAWAAWQEPKDGVMSEKQLTTYLEVQKDAIAQWKASGKALEGSQSSAAAMAVMLRNDTKFKANLASHGMSEQEYAWVGAKAWEAWSGVLMDKLAENTQKELEKQRGAKQKELADLNSKLATYENARKDGRRVMTRDERDSAINSAKDDQKSAVDEAKQHADEAKQAHDDAAKGDNDAKAADTLAASPPPEVSADDRQGFIDGKKQEAQTARDAAKEARDKEAEAKKAEAESKAKADAAGRRMKNPDVSVTDDEKAEVNKQHDEMIAAARADIDNVKQAINILDESGGAIVKQFQDQKKQNKTPEQNMDLLKKHLKEFQDAWGIRDTEIK